VREDGHGGHSQRDISDGRDEEGGTGVADRLPREPCLRFPDPHTSGCRGRGGERREDEDVRREEPAAWAWGREREDCDRNAKGAGNAMVGAQAATGQRTGCGRAAWGGGGGDRGTKVGRRERGEAGPARGRLPARVTRGCLPGPRGHVFAKLQHLLDH
jgi:hypothetical protein